MKQGVDSNDKNREAEDDQLTELIKQAGDEARARKKEALARHFIKIQAVITEALSSQQGSIPR